MLDAGLLVRKDAGRGVCVVRVEFDSICWGSGTSAVQVHRCLSILVNTARAIERVHALAVHISGSEMMDACDTVGIADDLGRWVMGGLGRLCHGLGKWGDGIVLAVSAVTSTAWRVSDEFEVVGGLSIWIFVTSVLVHADFRRSLTTDVRELITGFQRDKAIHILSRYTATFLGVMPASLQCVLKNSCCACESERSPASELTTSAFKIWRTHLVRVVLGTTDAGSHVFSWSSEDFPAQLIRDFLLTRFSLDHSRIWQSCRYT